MPGCRVLMVDDHVLFREGLRSLLDHEQGLEVVGEAHTARRALELADRHQPDVVLMDVTLPGQDGIDATRELLRRAPAARVLVLSMHETPEVAAEALDAGASGYALKSEPFGGLCEAIRIVSSGARYLSPGLPQALLRRRRAASDGPLGLLSRREREVFRLVIRGYSTAAVAKELCISAKTVETHRTRIHQKLGLHSVGEVIRFAARHGLLER